VAQRESNVAEKPDTVDARIALGSLALEDGNRDTAIARPRARHGSRSRNPRNGG
jgi:hypothetical protein